MSSLSFQLADLLSLFIINCKVHNRAGKFENSIHPALKFIEIKLSLPLTCSDEIVFKNAYIYHLIVNSLCLNQIISEL